MASQPLALSGSLVQGTCRHPSHHSARNFTGTWAVSRPYTARGVPIVLAGDQGLTDCNHVFIATGASTSTCNGVSVHRKNDAVTLPSGGEGRTVTGGSDVTSV